MALLLQEYISQVEHSAGVGEELLWNLMGLAPPQLTTALGSPSHL
jgi:hypothetical protein